MTGHSKSNPSSGIIIRAPLSPSQLSINMNDIGPTYGALYIGVLFATLFQGILTIQTYVYYESFPEDSIWLKSLVGTVWCVDLIHLIFVGHAVYYYLVIHWGDTDVLKFSIWTFDAHLVLLGLASILCQSFFIRRIWIFSNRNIPLLLFLTAICMTVFILAIYASAMDIKVPSTSEFLVLKPQVTALFSIGAGSDVIIALLMCYYLRKQNSNSTFARTHSIISLLIKYTVTTGLATSALAVACLITFFAVPESFVFIAMHLSLGRMYTNALLATLNSRRVLRGIYDPTSKGRQSMKPTSSSKHVATYKGQGVSIQIETVQETSERDPYVPSSKISERTERSEFDIELEGVEKKLIKDKTPSYEIKTWDFTGPEAV